MDNRFSPEEWAKLSADGRLHLCVSMARELREIAEPALVAGADYLRIADKWDALASEMAQAAR